MHLGLGLSLTQPSRPHSEGGGGDLPEAPEGFAYLVNDDSGIVFVVNADASYILAKVEV